MNTAIVLGAVLGQHKINYLISTGIVLFSNEMAQQNISAMNFYLVHFFMNRSHFFIGQFRWLHSGIGNCRSHIKSRERKRKLRLKYVSITQFVWDNWILKISTGDWIEHVCPFDWSHSIAIILTWNMSMDQRTSATLNRFLSFRNFM